MIDRNESEAPEAAETAHEPTRPGWGPRVWTRIKDIIFMVIAVFFLRSFVVQAYQIPSGSMENTLLVGDYLIANKFIYGPAIPFTDFKIKGKTPGRGEIVIFRSPTDSKDYIKRVVALPGEEIRIRDNQVYIDGKPLEEDYISLKGTPPSQADFGPLTVPEGHLFVMGDNRNQSYDSRFWGPLDEHLLRGKAEIIHWSMDGDHHPRLSRIGDLLR